MKILIVDDDKDIVELLSIYVKNEGYEVERAYNGKEAITKLNTNPDIGLMILDIMMPQMDGLAVVREVRKDSQIPVLMLSAKTDDLDKIQGLIQGADDYVTKPFNPVELLARVKSQLRRYLRLGGGSVRPTAITVGAVSLDDESKSVTVDGESVSLTPIEYDILRFLMQNAGKVFSPQEIYRRVWHEAPAAESPVPVHIRHIREKIEINPAEPRYLKVVWGKGYKMEVDAK